MGVELTFGYGLDDPASVSLATTIGWRDFCDWAQSLPEVAAPGLIHLCRYGWATGASEVRGQVFDALESHPPAAPDVAHTARRLTDILDGVDPDTTFTVEL